MSSAAQLRKIKKPLIEKRRRERMNDCLNQLKTLVLEGRNTNSNESRYSKMEKVDILEMTVRYLTDLRHSFSSCTGSPQSLTAKYIEGYTECASQVGQYLSTANELSDDTRQRLSQHLVDSLRRKSPAVCFPSPSAEPQTTGVLSFGEHFDSCNPFPSQGATDCSSTMLKTSTQNPSMLSSKFAVLKAESESLSPPACSRVIIPLYLPSLCSASPSILPINHSSTQPLASATYQSVSVSPVLNPGSSTPSTSSPTLFAPSISPNPASPKKLQVISGYCDRHGNSLCCSSPKQGDECPSSTSVFNLQDARSLTGNWNPSISLLPSNSLSVLPVVGTHHVDVQQTFPPEIVWRPWNNCGGKTS